MWWLYEYIGGLPDDSAFIRIFSEPIQKRQQAMSDLQGKAREMGLGANF